jgi:quinol-cytochrome oxidoreductase complex cytochrome b subunit
MSIPTGEPRRRSGWLDWLERRINLSELFSFLTHFGLVYTPVDSSRPIREVARDVTKQEVPAYATWPRVFGLLAAVLFALQVVTGVLLAYYYKPTPDAAFESTRTIVRDLPAGWFIHQMHDWGAYLLIAVIVLRLFRLFWDGLYRAPREILWVGAVAMAWVVLQLDFTGRLLGWDARSYWSTVRGMEVVFALPLIGPVLAYLLGGRLVNEDVLIRFYILHILVLPMFFAGFLYLTFATLRRVGLSPVTATDPGRTTTFRRHVYDMLIITVILFGALVSLATLVPFGFRNAADPYSTPEAVRPPWYMLGPYAALQRLPGPTWISGLLLLAIAIAVPLLPFWGRRLPDDLHEKRVRVAGIVVLGLWVALSAFGATLDRR